MMKKIFSLCIVAVVFFSFSSAFAAKGTTQSPKKNQDIS
jgi:hypothetical protein